MFSRLHIGFELTSNRVSLIHDAHLQLLLNDWPTQDAAVKDYLTGTACHVILSFTKLPGARNGVMTGSVLHII